MDLLKTLYTKEIRAMSHHNTIIGQVMKLVPRHEFETLNKGVRALLAQSK